MTMVASSKIFQLRDGYPEDIFRWSAMRGYKKIKVRLWRRTWPCNIRDMMDELSLCIKQIACQKGYSVQSIPVFPCFSRYELAPEKCRQPKKPL